MAYTNPLIESVMADIGQSRKRRSSLSSILGSLSAQPRETPQSSFSQPSGPSRGGSVDGWISEALRVLGQRDDPGLHNAVRILVNKESGGNPRAVNNWDSNARAGHSSRGLAQTIPSTFAAYRDPRLPNDIYNPVANLVAGLRYGTSRYGSIMDIPGIAAVLRGGAYRGY